MKIATGKSNIDIVKDYLSGNRPFIQVGFTGESNKYRKDGEIWKDKNGIEWKRQDGLNVKLTKTQTDLIRDAIGVQKCKCGLDIKWGNKFDRIFFAKTGMCQDCLAVYETRLRIAGAFDYYEKTKILSNEIAFFKDVVVKLKETIEFFSKGDTSIELLCNSEGYREKFHGTNSEELLEAAKKDLAAVKTHLKEITKLNKEFKTKLKQKAKEFKIKIV